MRFSLQHLQHHSLEEHGSLKSALRPVMTRSQAQCALCYVTARVGNLILMHPLCLCQHHWRQRQIWTDLPDLPDDCTPVDYWHQHFGQTQCRQISLRRPFSMCRMKPPLPRSRRCLDEYASEHHITHKSLDSLFGLWHRTRFHRLSVHLTWAQAQRTHFRINV